MAPKEQKRYCESHVQMEARLFDIAKEISGLVGKVEEAFGNMKADINMLFEHNRQIIKDINEVKQKTIPKIKIEQSRMKLKMAAIVGALSIAGSFITSLFLWLLNKIPWFHRG